MTIALYAIGVAVAALLGLFGLNKWQARRSVALTAGDISTKAEADARARVAATEVIAKATANVIAIDAKAKEAVDNAKPLSDWLSDRGAGK